MICHNKKFIFIHIPRTGGTSIESALSEYCEISPNDKSGEHNMLCMPEYKKHASISLINSIGIDIDNYYKFCVVRNPWDRILSVYMWGIQIYKKWIDFSDFNIWVSTYLTKKGRNQKIFQQNQIDYISIDEKVVMDHIIEFQTISEGWKNISLKLNIEKSLPIIYKTNHEQYQTYYNEESKNIISDMFQKDIEFFHYQF